jgi:multidrug resistance efflux pump
MATVEEAQANVDKAQAALDTAKADAATAAEAAARPRPVSSILIDIVRHLVSRAGNHPDLEKLEKELIASIAGSEPH